jgi:homeobox protein HLX1
VIDDAFCSSFSVLSSTITSSLTSELQKLQAANNYKNYKSSVSHHHPHHHMSHPNLLSTYTSSLFRNTITDATDLHNMLSGNGGGNNTGHVNNSNGNGGNHGANTKRKRSWSRAVFSNLQRKGLERQFEVQKYITKPDRRKLAARLGLTDAQVSDGT